MYLLLALPAVATPITDVHRGIHDAPFDVVVSGSGGALYCSTDLSPPSLPCVGPIPIRATTVLRVAEVAGDGSREESTWTYIFPPDVLASAVMDQALLQRPVYSTDAERALRELPVISLVRPEGIPMTEVAVSMEWIDPLGDSLYAGAGAYVSGGTSWAYEKTSFRLVYRSEYGAGHLEADIYGENDRYTPTGISPADRFDVLSLRGGNHDTVFYLGERGQHLRNLWMDETQLEQGHLAPHGRFASLYINGVYHGLYHVRERFNAANMAEYFGGSEDDYEAINAGTAYDGSGAAWAALVAASGDYQEARRWLDVPDYLDYMVLNFYAGNAWDWYSWHNWQATGPILPDAGGFRFHASDSDICLTYGWDINILSLGGPSDVFLGLQAEGDPDFQVALRDAIYRNLTGPLSAEGAAARYERIAATASDGLAAESARWGYGWWDRDGEWLSEKSNLLTNWFPYRTEEMWRQFRAAGWYPVEAPLIDTASGAVPAGTVVRVALPAGSRARLYARTDGGDPREQGGAAAAAAQASDREIATEVLHGMILKARLKEGREWGPLVEAVYTVDEPSPLILNEWNAVDPADWLGGAEGTGADLSLGRVQGNGGDWIELLTTGDIDLRGWRLVASDRAGSQGEVVISDDPALAQIRAGSLITVAADMPEDTAYDPEGGDWRIHLRAPIRVTAADWQLRIFDADGFLRFGPVGEGVEPKTGLSSKEVGALTETPDGDLRPDTEAYAAREHSSFGLPNVEEGVTQDLSTLRRQEPGDSPGAADTGSADTGAAPAPRPAGIAADPPCGCSGAPVMPALPLLPLVLLRRKRTVPAGRT